MKTYTSVQPEYSKNHTNDNNTDNTLQHKYHMMDINKCNPIGNYSNFFQWNATYQYEGIPENLFINSCGFIFLLFCFFFLRISAFNVANEETNKINLKATKKWKTLFFSINSKKEVNTRISSDTTIGRFSYNRACILILYLNYFNIYLKRSILIMKLFCSFL